MRKIVISCNYRSYMPSPGLNHQPIIKGQQLLCGYIKQKPERGFGLFPNSVIRILRDKMNPLGERRFWVDLQEEKRNPDKANKPAEDAQPEPEVATFEAKEEASIELPQETAQPPTEAPITEAPTTEVPPPTEAQIITEAPSTTQSPTTVESTDPIEIVQEAEKAELERLKSLEEEELKNLRPLQKTSQIWRWIDDMLDDKFVERLVLTLHDEQSALLLWRGF